MKYLYLSIFSLFLILSTSCIDNDSIEEGKIDLSPCFEQKNQNVSLSSIANHIEYIPLQTNSESAFGRIDKLFIGDNHVVVFGRNARSVLVFDIKGRFICDLTKKGKGPSEILEVSSLSYNQKMNKLAIMDNRQKKIITFDFNKEFLSTEFSIETFPSEIFLRNSGEYWFYFPPPVHMKNNRKYSFLIFNSEGKLLNRLWKRKNASFEGQ